jgi:hypothetical protein
MNRSMVVGLRHEAPRARQGTFNIDGGAANGATSASEDSEVSV